MRSTSGHVAGAGLDVFENEPPTRLALTTLPQVVATPHIAASTVEAQEQVGLETAAAVRDFLRDGVIRNAVNFPASAAEEFARVRPFMVLAERMGALVSQLADGRTHAIGIRHYGPLVSRTRRACIASSVVAGRAAADAVVDRHRRQRPGRAPRTRHRDRRVAAARARATSRTCSRSSCRRARASAGSREPCSSPAARG